MLTIARHSSTILKQESGQNHQAVHQVDGQRQDPFCVCRRMFCWEMGHSRYAVHLRILCVQELYSCEGQRGPCVDVMIAFPEQEGVNVPERRIIQIIIIITIMTIMTIMTISMTVIGWKGGVGLNKEW